MTATPRLDVSQRAAVEIYTSDSQVVIAGPGSGKTEVVASLVHRLVAEEDADEVLVLSFSNAAVFAVDARVPADLVGSITVQTIDSLAGELLADVADDDVSLMSFDERIARAAELLVEEGWDRAEEFDHVVVDEVQDVVGVRADFLLALLDALGDDCGFTLLGDPAQGIYDFQLAERGSGATTLSRTTASDLLRVAGERGGAEIKELTGQYRAASREVRHAMGLRGAVLGGDFYALEDFTADVVHVGGVPEALEHVSTWPGRTVFLTRTNGQALLVAESLREAGAMVEVRRAATDRVLPAWLGQVLGYGPASIAEEAFRDRLALAAPEVDPGAAWRALRRLANGRGRELDVGSAVRRLSFPRALPPVLSPALSDVVVSTVHRAKGLEFDHVVLLEFSERQWEESEGQREFAWRELFVAVTRARSRIIRADGPDDRSLRLWKKHPYRPRWYVGGPKKWMTHGWEFRSGDVDGVSPHGSEPRAVQDYLASDVRPGATLEFELDGARSSLQVPVYELRHSGQSVARTTPAFGEELASRIGDLETRRRGWPGLGPVTVERLGTVIGDARPGDVGNRGLWLAPMCSGLLQLKWNEGER